MANRLTEQHRKCIKSPNIFRDKQEYSSLYTISSRSALSLQSTEMMSSRNPHPGQNRMFKGQHYKGDSVDNVKSQPYKYPKLPNDVSLELQQKVYSSSQYYSDRTQFIKNKFDSLTLENNKQQYPKPYCPMHISTNRQPQLNPSIQPQYTINRLEESYWAKWKPNKCDSANTWQSCSNQTATSAPCSARRTRCVTTPMMSEECLDMLSKSKRRPKSRCCDDTPLEVIREPAAMHESNSSDVGIKKTASNKKVESKCSCCTCPSQSKSTSDDEKTSKTKTDVQTEDYDDEQNEEDDVNLETCQEEYENLYNEMYIEYETQLMNRISEYEMQREQEEMYELEKQLAAEEERKRREQEIQNEVEAMSHYINPSVHHVNEIDSAENKIHTPFEQMSQVSSQRNEAEIRPITAVEQLQSTPKERSLDSPSEQRPQTANNSKERGGVSPRENRSSETPWNEHNAKGMLDEHSDGVKNAQEYEQRTLKNAQNNQHSSSSERDRIELENKQRKLVLKNAQEREQKTLNNTQNKQHSSANKRDRRELENEHKQLMLKNAQEHEQRTLKNTQDKSSERDRIEMEDEQRRLRLLKTQETELVPHLSSSNEYSEPEIAILKHTDSFIINSRRQKEDRPRKQQPKFLKLKSSSFTAPPVKGHTYPLKPALKKEKQSPPPIIGFSRPVSPNTPKTRSPTKPPQYMYLMRH